MNNTVEKDILRDKMDRHVIDEIEKFMAPELRGIREAIRLARRWREEGVSLQEINARLEVLEEESIQHNRLMTSKNSNNLSVLIREEEVVRTANEPNASKNDTYYLHF